MSQPQDDTFIDVVRSNERHRLADLLESHKDALASYVAGPDKAIELVVFLLRLDQP
jgi:hypothetical protein